MRNCTKARLLLAPDCVQNRFKVTRPCQVLLGIRMSRGNVFLSVAHHTRVSTCADFIQTTHIRVMGCLVETHCR